MGQQGSSHDGSVVDVIQGKLKHHAEILTRMAKLSYKEFKDSVMELNHITSSIIDKHGKQLQFSIKGGSDDTILWKATVRVECRKVQAHSNKVWGRRDLTLRHYILVYKEITDQVNNLPPATPGGTATQVDICASMILRDTEHSLELEDECCICMQNAAKTILPCAHKFCENCCREWTDLQHTCPVCRENVASSNDTWELTDVPDSSEYATEVRDVLVGIADRHARCENT